MILAGAFLLSIVPCLAFYFWLKKKDPENAAYTDSCKRSLKGGILASLPIGVTAIALLILANALGMKEGNPYVKMAFEDFVLAALTEETFKFLAFRKVVRKAGYRCSWYDLTAFMTLVGIGFELLESAVYTFTSGPGQVLVRGITLMHGVFGFIMGYYYGKALYTGRKRWYIAAFLIPYLFHGIYDFTLSPGLEEVSDVFIFIPVTLAFAAFVLVFVMIRFFRKARKQEKYTVPVGGVCRRRAVIPGRIRIAGR